MAPFVLPSVSREGGVDVRRIATGVVLRGVERAGRGFGLRGVVAPLALLAENQNAKSVQGLGASVGS